MDRRTNTSDGSGGASPTVVTVQHDDDDDLTADTDQDTQIIATSAVRAARAKVARAAAAAKEVLANGGSAVDEKDAVAQEVPALPADTIGTPRDSSSNSRSVAAPAAPEVDDGWTLMTMASRRRLHRLQLSPPRLRKSQPRSRAGPDGRPAAPCSAPSAPTRRRQLRQSPSLRPFPRPRSCGMSPSRCPPHRRLRPGTSCARARTPRPRLRRGPRPSASNRPRLLRRVRRRPRVRGPGDRRSARPGRLT